MAHRNALDHVAADGFVLVKNANELKAALPDKDLVGYRLTQVAGTDQNGFQFLIHTQNFANALLQLRHIVAVTLLAKSPKAVKVVANLGGSQAHTVRQLLGADAHNAIVLQTLQKSVVSGQTLDDGHGYIFSFFHRVHPSQKNDFIWSSG